jgi:hypothetical protein
MSRLSSKIVAAAFAASLALSGTALAQVTVAIDVAADRHPISPEIYGVSYGTTAELQELGCPLVREGGNNATRYNWQENADNRAADWYFESIAAEGGSAAPGELGDSFVAEVKAASAQPMLTVPIIDWVAKLGSGRSKLASYSIAKYGAQTGNDWEWFPDAGNGILTNGTPITWNDPTDANAPNSVALQKGWAQHLVSRWGTAANGGLKYYILDNEHSIWFSTHRDVSPVGAYMEDIRDRMIAYASAIKAVDASAQIVGPEEWGWSGYLLSGYDQQWGAEHGWGGPLPDQEAHGGALYLPWLLEQLRQASTAGPRLLDVFTVHYYPQGGEYGNDVSQAMQLRRNRSTRSLWDPSYVDETWIDDTVRLVPRLREWVNACFPGTRIGITEYSWGAEDHINGATTQADVLGIFGREGLDVAARWVIPGASTPTFKAMKLYRNCDGAGGAFGETSVRAVAPNPDQLAAFAAQRGSDDALTVMVVSKVLSGATSVTLSLSGFNPGPQAAVWQLTSANAITRLADVSVGATSLTLSVPAQSITMIVIPKAGLLWPAGLVLDPLSQGVWGIGQTVALRPSWRNVGTAASPALAGVAMVSSGATLADATASYGVIAVGGTRSCLDEADCYGVTATGPRPGTHWDVTFSEALSDGSNYNWPLHVGDSFSDVPRSSPVFRFVETLLHQGVTGGCTTSTYCPNGSATRGQMAIFALLAKEGAGWAPVACGATPMYGDVPASSPYCRWVEELSRRGIASGCGGGNYCPTRPVTRGQMAILMLRTLDPASTPPACTTPVFADVPASSPYCAWVEELARRGIVSGCGGGNYCPTRPVTRGQMSVFLTLTFGLGLYGP